MTSKPHAQNFPRSGDLLLEQDLIFPPGFWWGTASSAHQTEGDNTNNQWWQFEQQPGAVRQGDRSGLACDGWRNAEQDFDRMAALGLNAHRLSVEWSRIEPRPNEFDHTAIDRYRAMLDALRTRGIRPMVCFHHFTDPLWFYKRGGWEQAESPARFQRFVSKTAAALGDLCDWWLTMNEPLVNVAQGWFQGIWPPQSRNPVRAMRVYRHLLKAHGAAYHAIHAVQPDAEVSYAKAVRLFHGLRPNHPGDRYAAGLRRYLYEHVWFMATVDGKIRPPVGAPDFDPLLADSFDFTAINYYTHYLVRCTPNPLALFGKDLYSADGEYSDYGRNGPYSEYYPQGLAQICREVSAFGKPILITENGLPDRDDDLRPKWLLGHLAALHRAIADGCDVRGYFHWTLVDNFEWSEGWGLRFGLIELDPETQARRPRPSAALYGQIARANGITVDLLTCDGA